MGTQDTLLGAVTKHGLTQVYVASIRKKRSYTQLDDIAPEDKELHEYSSSGYHSIARAKSKRGRGYNTAN
ncbi:hypothetical protein N7491_002763 [Penicillium cf. griseofulvum]|uniref:Uncharacterized protein n=1 Tax=Penicillium cf. griseofulvum TaxID=2972120 RepID=A0A9W9MSD6_9EURO|nr:hypothetical protein N7472_003070 [Penicillium cf. griseofulvum]KAJ5440357.1 hypothetical protein N7491_002763 [Penicillium cf. griseofulvum]